MSICDFQSDISRLQKETKRLRDRWEATKAHWQDQAASDFEETYLQPLMPNLRLTLASVHELADLVAQAEKACGDATSPE